MGKLKQNAVALSLGIAVAALSLLCLIFVAIFHLETVVKVANSFMHGLDVSGVAVKNITLAGSITGIIGSFLIGWFVGLVFAGAYNRLSRS